MAAVFGGMGPAIIGGAASLIGDFISSSGQSSANRANMEMMLQNEQWQTQMSNTQMQRRVADLKAAGLNPMLAVSSPGASVPGVGQPSMQNPSSSYGNLGSQATSALQLASMQAQIDKTKADTKLVQSQTPGQLVEIGPDGYPDYTNADGGALGNLNAAQLMQNVKNGRATWDKIQADIANTKSSTTINQAVGELQGLNVGILRATRDALVKEQLAETRVTQAGVAPAEAQSKIMQGPQGVWIAGIEKVLGMLPFMHSGVSLLNKLQYPTTGR